MAAHVGRALEFARQHHLRHGKVNPANVLVRKAGQVVKLADLMLGAVLEGSQLGRAALEHRPAQTSRYLYPSAVFLPDQWGNLLFSIYPHLLILLFLVSPHLGIQTSLDVFLWLLFVALGMQFNIQRVNGEWIAGFRNLRHTHVLVYPTVLLLAGYLTVLRSRFPKTAYVTLAVLVALSAWQSVSTATKTHVPFADRRNACHFLAALPPKTVYSDFQIDTWASILPEWKHSFSELETFDRVRRRAQIA